MAKGGNVIFTQAKLDGYGKIHDLTTDTIKAALITSAITPTELLDDPRWGIGGGTNLQSYEVTPGGNYLIGGQVITSTWAIKGSSVELHLGAASWPVSINNPPDARWVVIYNDTATGKQCLGFTDIGSTFSLVPGGLDVESRPLFVLS